MDIIYREQDNTFHLYNDRISYIFGIVKNKYLMHCYLGKRLNTYNFSNRPYFYDRGFCSNPEWEDRTFSLDTLLREYPDFGRGDFRSSAYELESDDGDRITRFEYDSYVIYEGKKGLEGMPAVYVEQHEEAKTLKITLMDRIRSLKLELSYTIFRDYDAIIRSARICNLSRDIVYVNRLMSMSVDLPESNYELLTLGGAHTKEKNVYRRPVCVDTVTVESCRGTSSPQGTPFLCLVRQNTTETSGEAIGINLIYSGDFYGCVQVSQYQTLRVQLGFHPQTFRWQLKPQEAFETPESVIVYSDNGLGEMSRTFHRLYQKRLCRGAFKEQIRPILLNSWEAMYFQVNEEKVLKVAQQAKELGIELFVLDDGWFRGRNTDTTSLGDWTADPEKFPKGIKVLADKITENGMKFGIWFEPEMISEESLLYKEHPEWIIRSKRYDPVLSRHQYVLDLSNPDVCSYITEAVSEILEGGKITYVKWDMNRHLTDLGSSYLADSCQKELSHRYVLGLYSVLEELTRRFPHVLFEGCSSGGGRFDAGMLAYMPQNWTSDNTDAVCRLRIQYGTSFLFPPITMGAHVSEVPNHQVGRNTPLETRFAVAMAANLGYELDPQRLSEEEKIQIQEQIRFYKSVRETIQFGEYYRLQDPFSSNSCAWNFVGKEGKEVVFGYVQVLSEPAYAVPTIRLQGLKENARYRNCLDGQIYGGDELMYAGITIPREKKDFRSLIIYFKKVEEE